MIRLSSKPAALTSFRNSLIAAAGTALVAIAALSAPASAQTPDKWAAGEATFKDNCVLCHGENLAGSPVGASLKVKDLRSKEVLDKTNEDLAHTVTAGKNNMPPFGTRLSADQIQSVVEYIRHKAQTPPQP